MSRLKNLVSAVKGEPAPMATPISIQIPDEVMQDFALALPGAVPEEVALLAFKQAVGQAMLRTFSSRKQDEIRAEALRLNDRYGLPRP